MPFLRLVLQQFGVSEASYSFDVEKQKLKNEEYLEIFAGSVK